MTKPVRALSIKEIWDDMRGNELIATFRSDDPRFVCWCAICENRVVNIPSTASSGWMWVHVPTNTVYCQQTKQRGPRSKRVLPVPRLMVIEEVPS